MQTAQEGLAVYFSKFIVNLYHLGYNFTACNTKSKAKWTLDCTDNHHKMRVTYNTHTNEVRVISSRGEKKEFSCLEDLYRILLHNASNELLRYTQSTLSLMSLISITEGVISIDARA